MKMLKVLLQEEITPQPEEQVEAQPEGEVETQPEEEQAEAQVEE